MHDATVERAKVLVVDDEELIREAISDALGRFGYIVQTAHDGIDAEQVLRVFKPDLMICDLVMPRKDGFVTIEDARRDFPTMLILAISGGERQQKNNILSDALNVGADATLAKPFGAREILRLVQELLPVSR